ncbi:unnamed protein product [Peniophora sp. CBMAI 1063]|nr:unnamed protein product [Peniophora sp. CBMAI 1063]
MASLLPLLLLALRAQAYTSRHVAFGRDDVEQRAVFPTAKHVVSLSQTVPRPASKAKALRHLTRRPEAANSTIVTVSGSDQDEEYLTNITFGTQTFPVIIDTGSSDTWLVSKGFQCISSDGDDEPESECDFGSSGYDANASSTFVAYPGHNFNIEYGDGEFLTGDVGFETVTVGDLTVTHQEVGVVTTAFWFGDTVSSGLMGLCYPGLTSVFNTTNPDDDSSSNAEEYDPFFFTAIKEGAVSQPIFSVALNRGSVAAEEGSVEDPNLGFLAFGGIAPVDVTTTTVTVPIQGEQVSAKDSEFFFYTVDIDSYVFPGSDALSTSGQSILDTGTTLLYLPTPIANALAAAFDPPAVFSDDEGAYIVDCNATAPEFSVVIGGVSFAVTAADLILPIGADEDGNQVCISGHDDGGPDEDGNIFILGDTFLHNVVSTFDLSNNTVTLTERAPY